MSDYEIYQAANGRRVNIGASSYALEVYYRTRSGENSTNVAVPYEGDPSRCYDDTLRLWLLAAQEVGVPLRYSHGGIANALGHYTYIAPPWGAKPRDFERVWPATTQQA